MKAQLLSKKGIRGFKVAASGEHGLRPWFLGLCSVKSQGKIPRSPEPGLLVLKGRAGGSVGNRVHLGCSGTCTGPPLFTENLGGPSKMATSVLDILKGGKNRDKRGEFGPGQQHVTLANSLPLSACFLSIKIGEPSSSETLT